jgi:hypothetical protein
VGDPAGSNVTADLALALRVTGTHKPLHRNKAVIPSGGRERIMSMKNSSDTIGNGTCDLPVCSTVHQPNDSQRNIKLPRVPSFAMQKQNVLHILIVCL